MAFAASERATCPRRSVGCVIVVSNELVAMGYNGAPSSFPHCFDSGCMMDEGHCIRTIHAECNALLRADFHRLLGAHIYVTDYPCVNCARMIRNTSISSLFYGREYRPHPAAETFLARLAPRYLETPSSQL